MVRSCDSRSRAQRHLYITQPNQLQSFHPSFPLSSDSSCDCSSVDESQILVSSSEETGEEDHLAKEEDTDDDDETLCRHNLHPAIPLPHESRVSREDKHGIVKGLVFDQDLSHQPKRKVVHVGSRHDNSMQIRQTHLEDSDCAFQETFNTRYKQRGSMPTAAGPLLLSPLSDRQHPRKEEGQTAAIPFLIKVCLAGKGAYPMVLVPLVIVRNL